MKSFLIIITLTLVSYNISFTQSNAKIVETKNELTTRTSDTEELTYYSSHTQSAFKQLQNYSITNIKYPEHLIEYGLEGVVVVNISIATSGEIEEVKVVKSFSTSFNKTVLKEMKKCSTLTFPKGEYKGNPTVNLPIRFSSSK